MQLVLIVVIMFAIAQLENLNAKDVVAEPVLNLKAIAHINAHKHLFHLE